MYEDEKRDFIYDVSIIIVSYNPKWSDMERTLNSAISQKGISFEIIVADDGSENSYEKEIREYLENNNVLHYTLVMNKENKGTVCNLMSGLEVAKGKYVKDIGPGDYLYETNTLSDWIDYMEKEQLLWSFSEALYYAEEKNGISLVSTQAHPNDLKPYLRENFLECRWNYVVIGDTALGATMLCKTSLQYGYCKKILNKVKYAEDYIWRIMMFDGIKFGYYRKVTIYYQYGTGVSTSGKQKWKELLKRDWKSVDEIICNSTINNLDKYQKKMVRGIKLRNNKVLKAFVHGEIKSVLNREYRARKTSICLPKEK